jgi:peptide/nickel transport system permease protein
MYLIRRIGQSLGILWGILTLLFLIFYALGDPTEYLVGESADEATRAAIRRQYGLDQPLPLQYLAYLNQLSPLGLSDSTQEELPKWVLLRLGRRELALKMPDLGRSFQTRGRVSELIGPRLEGTALLALAAMLLAAPLGILLGVLAALRYQRPADRLILSLSVLGISAPSFFVGVLILWLFAVQGRAWSGLPAGGYAFVQETFSEGRRLDLRYLLLPALALGIRPLAVFVQLTRSAMLETLGMDYVRTARAKGLSPWRVLALHALRNAINPVLTSISGWLASLLAGAFFIEYIFDWQGIGKLMIDALGTNDFPVIIACALLMGLIFTCVSLLTDLLYRWLDPRVRLG